MEILARIRPLRLVDGVLTERPDSGHKSARYLFLTTPKKVYIYAFFIATQYGVEHVTIDIFWIHNDLKLYECRAGFGQLEKLLKDGNREFEARQEPAAGDMPVDRKRIIAAELARQSDTLNCHGWISTSCNGSLPETLVVDPKQWLEYLGHVKIGVGELLDLTDAERGDLHRRIVPPVVETPTEMP